MDACGCDDFASIFDHGTAERDLDRYRKQGPDRTTRILLDMIRPYLATGSTVLDVGGGIGVIDHELLLAGAGHAVLVDAAPAYLDAARQEASRLNLLDRIELVEGDFVGAPPESTMPTSSRSTVSSAATPTPTRSLGCQQREHGAYTASSCPGMAG